MIEVVTRLTLFQIDAFTTAPFTGNPAAVVLDGEGLDETTMQAIAREMNLSETAFLSSPSVPAAHYRLRWFTPTREVTFCGHATIATCHALFEAIAEAHRLRGICVTTFETLEPGSACHSRFFAPHYGIPEDPVTGSVHASLPLLLWEAGRLPRTDGVHRIQAEQGDELGRPGRLLLDITVAAGAPTAIRVGGQAVTVARGEIFVP